MILPSLAKNHAAEDSVAFSNSLDWGLRLVFLVGMPATIGLLLLAEPMISTLFQYNKFSVRDVHYAGMSLRAYSISLLDYRLIKVLLPGFTSRQDMKTPVRYGFYAMIVSLVLNVVLGFPLAHAGLALATSLGAFFNAVLLLKKLRQENVYQPARGWWLFFIRVLLASAAMSAALYCLVDASWWNQWNLGERVINLLKWIVIGIAIYAATLVLNGLRLRHLSLVSGIER